MKLHHRLAITFTLFGILASTLVIGGAYLYNRRQVREDTSQRLLEIVNLGAQRLDGDLHATLTDPAQEGSPAYNEFKSWLQEIRDASPSLTYVYTMRFDDTSNQMVFIVDAETDPDLISHLGDPYPELEPEMLEIIAHLTAPAADTQPYSDRWGTWLSAYAPVRTSGGKVDAILGIDMSLEAVQTYENRLLLVSMAMLGISTVGMVIAGWLIGKRLAQPLEKLTERTGQIANIVATRALDTTSLPIADLPDQAIAGARNAPLEIDELGQAFDAMTAQLRGLVGSLEERVEQRTDELEKQTRYLQATAELTRSLSSILDPERLAQQAVQQICQRFDLYYVGLFLVDEKGEWAMLQAAANSPSGGNASQLLIERGFRLLIPSGMVGWSIANNRPRVAQVARQDEVRLTESELPNTRSEAALPLRVARQSSVGRVIGALNLHSEEINAFDEQTITALGILADLLAIALENARAYSRSQSLLEAERLAAGEADQQAWLRLVQSRPGWGYQYTRQPEAGNQGNLRAVAGTPTEPVQQAIQNAQMMQDQEGRLVMPIRVRDQVVGVMSFRRPMESAPPSGAGNGPAWLPDEISILQELMNDVGQALEGARLYQETQRRAAREQITSEITAAMRASLDLETVLQTAARQIGEKLGNVFAADTTVGEDRQAGQTGLVVEVQLGDDA